MIDYLFSFTNEAAAKADPVVGTFFMPATAGVPATWRGDVCIPGISVAVAATAIAVDSNWDIVIAQTNPNSAFASHANLVASFNRDTGQLVSPTAAAVWKTRALFPLFAGTPYATTLLSPINAVALAGITGATGVAVIG